VGNFEFGAHGESVDGPDEGPVHTNHTVTASVKITQSGTFYAMALCNIHGLWEYATKVELR
jgi:superoxide reductase